MRAAGISQVKQPSLPANRRIRPASAAAGQSCSGRPLTTLRLYVHTCSPLVVRRHGVAAQQHDARRAVAWVDMCLLALALAIGSGFPVALAVCSVLLDMTLLTLEPSMGSFAHSGRDCCHASCSGVASAPAWAVANRASVYGLGGFEDGAYFVSPNIVARKRALTPWRW